MTDRDQIMDGEDVKELTDQYLGTEYTDLPIDWTDVSNDPRISQVKQEAKELCKRLTSAPPLEWII